MSRAEEKIQRLEDQVIDYKERMAAHENMQCVFEQQFEKNEKQLRDLKKINKDKQDELEQKN